MSKQPFEVLSNWDKSFDESGETSGSNEWVRNDQVAINYDSDEDELSETGDVGFGQHVYASYQKSGNKSVKGKDKLKMSEIDGFEEGDSVDINSSLKPRQCTTYMWLRHPQVRENWKTVVGAICLLIIGILFLICGIVLSAIPKHDGPKSIIFFVCAAVCILPGGYHTVYIYRATKGWRGYNFESLPSFQ